MMLPIIAAAAVVLPSISASEALPYPASGTPQPQIVARKRDSTVAATVTLDQAIAVAIDRVASLAAARAAVGVEDAAIATEKTGLAPSISAQISSRDSYSQGGSYSTNSSGTTGSSTPYSLSNTADLTVSQLIYDGGRIRAAIEAATATRDAAVATYKRDTQTVAYDVASAYYNLLAAQRTVAVDLAIVNEDVVSENLVRAQIQSGTEPGVDLITQQATTASARTALVTAQGIEQTARVAFATALGLGADTDVSPVDDSSGLENASPALKLPTYDAALAVANGERGDLQADRLLVASSQSSLRSAKLGLSPTVSLGATKDLDSTSIGGNDFRNDASLGVSISISIYDQGITKANVASAKATLAENQANTQTTGLTVQSDVRDALITVVSDRSSLDEARAAYAAAQASLASTQGQYRVGVTNLPTLITAETTLASASTTLVTSIYTFQFAQANLRYEMGTNLES